MKNKKIVFWGAGEMCRNFMQIMKTNSELRPEYIVDRDTKKQGTFLDGTEIVSPEKLLEDQNVFILVTSQYVQEIFGQLKSMGFVYGADYLEIQHLYRQPVPMEAIQEALEETCFQQEPSGSEVVQRVNSMEEYKVFQRKNQNGIHFEKLLARIYSKMLGKMGSYKGYCEICEEEREFQVDFYWAEKNEPAWRETLSCPVCHCNSRMRFVAGYLKAHHKNKKVYCYERKTILYQQLQSCLKDLTGSEYLGDDLPGGTVIDGIMHQDATNLSFEENTFDVMVSCDVFEHVSDYRKALEEAGRCLVPGGELIVSIPIFKNRYGNVARTVKGEKGDLVHLLPPVYHGNPLSNRGSLVFQEFGWQFLDDLKEAGFREAWALAYFSASKGYMGELPVIFIARKQV